MKEKPILFSGPMVRAILDGRKTQTRRLVKLKCPYEIGMRLWVWETFHAYPNGKIIYRATIPYGNLDCHFNPWTPSTCMGKKFSRLTLEVTNIRVERLQEITEEDAKKEGAIFHDGRGIGHSGWRHDYRDVYDDARSSYAGLCALIHGPGSWEDNPFVWVYNFKRLDEK